MERGGLFEREDLFEKGELIKDFLHFNFTKKFNEVVYGRFANVLSRFAYVLGNA